MMRSALDDAIGAHATCARQREAMDDAIGDRAACARQRECDQRAMTRAALDRELRLIASCADRELVDAELIID
jgi:hypothetical protein